MAKTVIVLFHGDDDALTARGVTLEFARDAFLRCTLDGATVISF